MSRGTRFDTGIAVRLREFRGERRQGEMAEAMQANGYGFDQPAVSAYENDTKQPPQYIIAFCDTFNVNPAWLLFGRPPVEWDIASEDRERSQIIAGWLRRAADELDPRKDAAALPLERKSSGNGKGKNRKSG